MWLVFSAGLACMGWIGWGSSDGWIGFAMHFGLREMNEAGWGCLGRWALGNWPVWEWA